MSTVNLCMYKRIQAVTYLNIYLHTHMVLVGHEHWNSKCPLLISAFIEEWMLLSILIYIQTRVVLVTHEHEIYLKQLIASFLSVHGVNQTIKTHAHTHTCVTICKLVFKVLFYSISVINRGL